MDRPKRGLGSLIPTGEWEIPDQTSQAKTEIEISQIRQNPYQPRLNMESEPMQELIESVRSHGIIQPLLVRRDNGAYCLVAGHRRLQAATAAGLTHVPVVVRQCTDREMLELALVENLQREDINAIDRAKAYQRLKDEFTLDQEDIAAAVGKSRASVANSIRLLNLPMRVQHSVSEGKLSEGHGRALLGLPDPEDMIRTADLVAKRGLSVRATEALVKKLAKRPSIIPLAPSAPKDPNLVDLESRLAIQLGTRVQIVLSKSDTARGYLHIEFYGNEDLDRISSQLLGE